MPFLYFILLLGGLIFFHELGHFTMARLTGVHVSTFSIGFGPALFRWRRKGTEYRIAVIPLGGFVKLLGDDPHEEVPEELRAKAFLNKSLWRRFWIVFGGPLFNLILPFILYFIIGLSAGTLQPAVVGAVVPGGPADQAHLRTGDRIVEVAGEPVRYWWQLRETIGPRAEQKIRIVYERGGERQPPAEIVPAAEKDYVIRNLDVFDTVGRIGILMHYPLPIAAVRPGSPAAEAGIKSGDRILKVAGREVKLWRDAESVLSLSSGAPVEVEVLREAERPEGGGAAEAPPEIERKTFQLAPGAGGETGLRWGEFVVRGVRDGSPAARAKLQEGDEILSIAGRKASSWTELERYLRDAYWSEVDRGEAGDGPVVQVRLRRAGEEKVVPMTLFATTRKTRIHTEVTEMMLGVDTWSEYGLPDPVPNEDRFVYALHRMARDPIRFIRVTALGIGGLFMGKVSFREMGGPIMVYNLASATADLGWEYFLRIMAILSISLGLLNLLPIPVLDGGHIFFIIIEAIQRKPISLRVRQVTTYVGLGLILLLMIMVFKNDIERNWDSIVQLFGG